jgi:hypothetical protein
VAKMPKYEKIRNRRERIVSKALASGSRKNVLFAVINSAFFLWCLSALLLTIGGGYITNHQQCMRDADQLVERRNMVSKELSGRLSAFFAALEAATTLKQLPVSPSASGSAVSELSKLSYFDVQQEWWKILSRTEYDELPYTSIRNTQIDWLKFNHDQAHKSFEEAQLPVDGKARKLDPTLEFRFRKLHRRLFVGLESFQYDIDRLAYYYEPNCTPLRTFAVALGYKPQIVRARVSPFIENEILNPLAETIEGFDKLKSETMLINSAMMAAGK